MHTASGQSFSPYWLITWGPQWLNLLAGQLFNGIITSMSLGLPFLVFRAQVMEFHPTCI